MHKRAATPFPAGYRPETDLSDELQPEEATFYQSQVGILRWIVEIGRIDIITETSLLALQMVMPRAGHLEAMLHVFAYLKNRHNSTMVFDPTYPDIDESSFITGNWNEFYGKVKEPVPLNAPVPRGKEVETRLFVDSDHAGNPLTRRS